MVRALARFKSSLNYIVMIIASIFTIILVLGALWQVISRYVIGDPSTFTEELLRFLLVWVAFLGATYAFGSNQHLAIVFVKNKLKGQSSKNLQLFIDVIVIVFIAAILVRGGYSISASTMNQLSPILRIPMGVVYSILPISGVLMIFYQLINILERTRLPDAHEDEAKAVLDAQADREV